MDENTSRILIALGAWVVVSLPTIIVLVSYYKSRTGFKQEANNGGKTNGKN